MSEQQLTIIKELKHYIISWTLLPFKNEEIRIIVEWVMFWVRQEESSKRQLAYRKEIESLDLHLKGVFTRHYGQFKENQPKKVANS